MPIGPRSVVVVGGGQAAAELTVRLRVDGYTGPVTVIGDEPYLPYMRPPLSKTFLAGEVTLESLVVRSQAAYDAAHVTVRTGVRVDAIHRHDSHVQLSTGENLAYGALALATGGQPRRMTVPGADLPGIHVLRTIADVEAIRLALQPGLRLAIIGGGYIGLEVAAIARKLGLSVTVLEAAPRVLARVTAPEMSAFYERVHRAKGVDIRTGTSVSGFIATSDGSRVAALECGQDAPLPCDLVIVGIGIVPNTSLAETSGIAVDAGIVVDADGRTGDPNIYALGDCARHARHGFLHRSWRLESVPNALEQARVVSASITDKPRPELAAPWFWSDQYGLKLQMVGISEGYEEIVVRGSPDDESFIAFYLAGGVVIAADAVNRLGEFMTARKLVGGRYTVPSYALTDEKTPLKTLL